MVHVLTRLVIGGPTRPVLSSLQYFAKMGCRPVLVTGVPEKDEEECRATLSEYPDIPVLRLACLRRAPAPWCDLRATATLVSAIRRLGARAIHTHTAKAGALGRASSLFGRSGKTPSIHTFHGHSLSHAASGRMAPLWTLLERGLARRLTDMVITLSPALRADIVSRLGDSVAGKCVVVPLAFEGRASRRPIVGSKPPPWRERREGERLLAFVGRGAPVKGLAHLARSHVRLAGLDLEAASRLRILIVGPIPEKLRAALCEILASAGLVGRWEFTGTVSDPTVFLPLVDAVVLPSLSEGTPVSVLEAFDAGLPVLASRVGGVGELLEMDWIRAEAGSWSTRLREPRGLLLPAADEQAWAQGLKTFCLTPHVLSGQPDERRRFVREVFDPQRNTMDMLTLYRGLGLTFPPRLSRAIEAHALRRQVDPRPPSPRL